MIDGSIAGIVTMTDDTGTLFIYVLKHKNFSQTVYRFNVFQHNISFQSHLEKLGAYFWGATSVSYADTFNLHSARLSFAPFLFFKATDLTSTLKTLRSEMVRAIVP